MEVMEGDSTDGDRRLPRERRAGPQLPQPDAPSRQHPVVWNEARGDAALHLERYGRQERSLFVAWPQVQALARFATEDSGPEAFTERDLFLQLRRLQHPEREVEKEDGEELVGNLTNLMLCMGQVLHHVTSKMELGKRDQERRDREKMSRRSDKESERRRVLEEDREIAEKTRRYRNEHEGIKRELEVSDSAATRQRESRQLRH